MLAVGLSSLKKVEGSFEGEEVCGGDGVLSTYTQLLLRLNAL